VARRSIAALMYGTAGLTAILDPTPVGLGLAVASVVFLTIGYRYNADFALVASGWLLYLPLATIFSPALGAFWSYMVSGTYLAVVTERLSFENQLSLALEGPSGVDAEAKRLSSELSSRHLRRLTEVIFFVFVISILSAAVSLVISEVDILILASVMLFIAVGLYARRAATRSSGPAR